MDSRPATTAETNKRPRSPSGDFPPITSKAPKTHANHLQINYLARQFQDNLPLVSAEDTLPSILNLIADYDGVLHRHESIAGNLGACPLGPILVKRFERLFDGPPKVLKSHGKEGTNITWLDVVEFAKNKPEQFNLEKTRNGVRVCQIYTKQTRIEISEEDYVLIASGMPQKMIPPQPISEDEEKELGALEILEKNLSHIIQLADQVSARARQLNHRLKNRKNAIVSRRETEASTLASQAQESTNNPWKDTNGNRSGPGQQQQHTGNHSPHSPPSGFVAVNSRADGQDDHLVSGSHFMFSNPNTDNVTIINGTSIKGASPATRAELMKKFFTTQDNRTRGGGGPEEDQATNNNGVNNEHDGARNNNSSRRPRASDASEYSNSYAPVAIPGTPSSLLPQPKSNNQYERDDGGPFKIEMVSRMEDLSRGDRILPPCDRCRRLHMDCLKNLTACMGCTKKHAKCSWKEVTLEELRDVWPAVSRKEQISRSLSEMSPGETATNAHDPGGPAASTNTAGANPDAPAVTDRPASEPHGAARSSPPRRALSDSSGIAGRNGNGNGNVTSDYGPGHDPRSGVGMSGRDEREQVSASDANDPLAQAIMDTVDTHRARTAAAAAAAAAAASTTSATERDRVGGEIRAQ